ncbi:CRE-PCP-1 protein, partial [Aphelenchoides avenae]
TDDPAYIAGTVQPIVAEAYEHCTGTALYRCPMGDANDFFPKTSYCGTVSEFADKNEKQCKDWLSGIGFMLNIDTTWIRDNIKFDYTSKNHIVFVTGSLDPNAGGVYTPKNANADAKNSIYAYQAERGTTGHDLLEPNTCDPNTVKNTRYQIVKIVKCWSGLLSGPDCAAENLQKDLPNYDSTKPATCAADAYPWGQTEATTSTSITTTPTTTTSTTTTFATTTTSTATKAPCYECKTVFFFIKVCMRSASQDCAIVSLE